MRLNTLQQCFLLCSVPIILKYHVLFEFILLRWIGSSAFQADCSLVSKAKVRPWYPMRKTLCSSVTEGANCECPWIIPKVCVELFGYLCSQP